ncbi:MAG: hypothetical protein AB7F65_06130 [Dehalococcoidia bacterium]
MFEFGSSRSTARTVVAVLLMVAALGATVAFLTLGVLDAPDAAEDLLADRDVLDRLTFSIAQAAAAAAIGLAAGLPASWLLSRHGLPARGLLGFLLAAPIAIPGVVVALGLDLLAGGEILPRVLVVAAHSVFACAVVTWLVAPAWASGDRHATEDARLLGAGAWSAFLAGTGRQLPGAVRAAAALAFWYAFAGAATVTVLGGGDATTLESTLAFGEPPTIARPEVSDALAAESGSVALAQFVLGAIVLALGGTRWPRPTGRRGRAPRAIVALGAIYLLALIGITWAPAVAVATEAAQASALAEVADAIVAGDEGLRLLAWTGILGMLAAALATTLAWLGAAAFARPTGGRRGALGRALLVLPAALTGAVVGWAGLVLAEGAGLDLERTYVLTVAAHALIAYPFALRLLSMRRRPPRMLLEDAVLLGGSEREVRWRWMGRRTLLTLMSAALVSFAISAGEVAATNLLTPGEATPAVLGILRGWEDGAGATPPEVYALGTVLAALTVVAFGVAEWLRRAAARVEAG